MTEHTPLPWRISETGSRTLVRGADATIVAIRHRLPGPLHEANAALIIRAVNSHEALVKALEEIAEGRGRYSQDRFEHACNTVEDMKQLARDALAVISDNAQEPK